jgi:hypothetical protein
VVVFLPLAIIEFYRKRTIPNRALLILFFFIIALSMSGFISGMINGNSLLITSLGIFDYVKNLLVIFIYTAFFREVGDFKRIFRFLLAIGVSLGVVAFVQEVWALLSVYVFGHNIYQTNNYLLLDLGIKINTVDFWRLGIYRAPSLLNHPNSLGLYCLLILTIYLFIVKKVNLAVFTSLFMGVFVSVSRMIYTAFMVLAGSQIFKGRKWFIIPTLSIITLIFFMSFLPDFNVKELLKKEKVKREEVKKEEWFFRAYAKNKAIQIWKDHKTLGVGPGMFGGVTSIVFNSPVYKEYNFSQKWYEFMRPFRSLDQFWPQIMAEMGIIGALFFAGLLISLLIIFYLRWQHASDDEKKGLFAGLMIATIYIFIYSLGSGLNMTLFLFTYSALAGMGLGYENSTHK